MKSKWYVLIACFVAVFGLSAVSGISHSDDDGDHKHVNLKILPKDISAEELDDIMKSFNKALGVKCNYCHALKTNGERGLDFPSDANPMKEIARDMLKMTKKINKKYFKNFIQDGILKQVSCMTCHNGNSSPVMVEIKK
ncbi:MAG: c-type cytochrome [Saprospiraceae bacterium]|nr:MAG: Cytochrome c-554 precursor [Bacteroidetes bacterium OLB9]MCO6463378.1 c-type cytochrome [Saprospiraceae bacterium]MCZ2338713.1 c-type cytochrome [Chitinophagales bacterium]